MVFGMLPPYSVTPWQLPIWNFHFSFTYCHYYFLYYTLCYTSLFLTSIIKAIRALYDREDINYPVYGKISLFLVYCHYIDATFILYGEIAGVRVTLLINNCLYKTWILHLLDLHHFSTFLGAEQLQLHSCLFYLSFRVTKWYC